MDCVVVLSVEIKFWKKLSYEIIPVWPCEYFQMDLTKVGMLKCLLVS